MADTPRSFKYPFGQPPPIDWSDLPEDMGETYYVTREGFILKRPDIFWKEDWSKIQKENTHG